MELKCNDTECWECNILTDGETYTTINGNMLCKTCCTEKYTKCYKCDLFDYDRNITTIYSGNGLCSDCIKDYIQCEECGEYYHECSMFYNERRDRYYCEECDPGARNDLQRGDYEPDDLLFLKSDTENKPIYFGFELEAINHGYSADDIAEDLESKLHVYCKNDGSLDGEGFEIVSHPMTLGYIKENRVFETIGEFNNSLKSFHDSRTGFHVHMTKSDFTSLHLYKFIAFHEFFQDFIIFVAQRKPNKYWKFYNSSQGELMILARDKEGNTSRYMAINLQNPNTIEMRYFKGNLKADRNYKNIEFLHALYSYTKQSNICVNLYDFLNYCFKFKKQYPNLINYYIENKNLLLNKFNYHVPEKPLQQRLSAFNYTSDNTHDDSLVVDIMEV